MASYSHGDDSQDQHPKFLPLHPTLYLAHLALASVETDKRAFALSVNQAVRMNTKTFHHTQASWQGSVTHEPNQVMHGFGR